MYHRLTHLRMAEFQSTRLSRASTIGIWDKDGIRIFQSTRLSRASTICDLQKRYTAEISIHKALTSLDRRMVHLDSTQYQFQSTRLSRASTVILPYLIRTSSISIHKALTSLDSKNTQLSLHPCQIYIS